MTPIQIDAIALLPCPLCGGKAHFDSDDLNWEWIECGQCHVATNKSVSAMEDCKPILAEGWNRRTVVIMTVEPSEDACTWAEEESDEYNERHFESACGLGFHLDDGRSLAENKILFCAKCGKKISEAKK